MTAYYCDCVVSGTTGAVSLSSCSTSYATCTEQTGLTVAQLDTLGITPSTVYTSFAWGWGLVMLFGVMGWTTRAVIKAIQAG